MEKNKSVRNLKNIFSENAFLYKFYFLYFFKSISGPIIILIIPFIGISFLYLMTIMGASGNILNILPSTITSPLPYVTLIVSTFFIIDIKKNSLAEKYFVFSKRSFSVNLVPFLFAFSITFFTVIWNLILICLISLDTNSFKINFLENISWGKLIFSLFFSTILFTSIGLLMALAIKSKVILFIVDYIAMSFLTSLSGGVIPLWFIATNQGLNIASYFSILRYINGLVVESLDKTNLTGTNIFNLSTPYEIRSSIPELIINEDGTSFHEYSKITIFHTYDQSLNLFIIVFGSIGLLTIVLLVNKSKNRK